MRVMALDLFFHNTKSATSKIANTIMESVQLAAIAICPSPTPIKMDGNEPKLVNTMYFGYLKFNDAVNRQIMP